MTQVKLYTADSMIQFGNFCCCCFLQGVCGATFPAGVGEGAEGSVGVHRGPTEEAAGTHQLSAALPLRETGTGGAFHVM